MAQFKAFKPEAMERIARSMGHQGDMNSFQQFLISNPEKQNQMNMYTTQARQMAVGGYVRKMQEGGDTNEGNTDENNTDDGSTGGGIFDETIGNIDNPEAPEGGTIDPVKIGDSEDSSQTITKGTGDIDKDVNITTETGDAKTADYAQYMDDETYDKFDGTPNGEVFDNLIDLEDYLGLSK